MLHNSYRNIVWVLPMLLLSVFSARAQAKRDSVHFDKSELMVLPAVDSLYVRDNPYSAPNCGEQIKSAKLKAYLYMGETYKLGSTAFSGSATMTIKAYNGFGGSAVIYDQWDVALTVNQDKPEEIYIKDFTAQHGTINRFVISITGASIPGGSNGDSLQVAVFYEEEFGVDVTNAAIVQLTPTVSTPMTFRWNRGTSGGRCTNIPNYQFQLLRLYNNDSTNTSETTIDALVDWDQALTIETGSADTFLTLTVAEGRGYYIWRVRPIGTYYDGGIADSRNYGSWSSSSTYADDNGYALSSTTADAEKFWYHQFNNDKNWIYSRTFSEGDPSNTKVRISEGITYANGLQQVKQSQAKQQSRDNVVVSQTLYDWSGRPAIATLPAPVEIDSLYYQSAFAKRGSNLFTPIYFDEDTNYYKPLGMTAGLLTTYYSNSNTDSLVPNAEDYPYSRALYTRDATNRVREQGGPGLTHRIKTGVDHTTKTYYGGVSSTELIRVFGDEAPIDTSVHKVINVDANETVTVTYIGKEGQTLATCLAIGMDSTGVLDTLPSQSTSRFTINDTIRGGSHYGDYGITASRPLVLATPTTVSFRYRLSAKEIEHICMDYCQTCDYTAQILIRSEDTTILVSRLLSAEDCGSLQRFDTTFSKNLKAGEYFIEKRVYANNDNPVTATDSTNAMSFLDIHLDSLRQRLQDTADARLDSVYYFLNHSDMSGLWDYLNVTTTGFSNPDSLFADSTVTFSLKCADIEIPVMVCPSYNCNDSTPDFEAYFNQRWASTSYIGTTGGYLNYFLPDTGNGKIGYRPGEFNTMIANMIAENGWNGYDCETLWECWDGITQSYGDLKAFADSSGDYSLDLLKEFLNCTGTKYSGYRRTHNDSAFWKYKPYQYFFYSKTMEPYCDTALTDLYGAEPWSPATDSIRGLPQNQKYRNYFLCTQNINMSLASTPATATADAQCGCYGVCEMRYEGFKQELIRMYHNDSIYVEGDRYILRPDSTWGQEYAFSSDTLTSTPGSSYYRSMSEIECAARSLVAECQKSCSLTVFTTSGHIDSIGTQAQLAALEQAMTWSFELKRPSCGAGWTGVGPPTSGDNKLVRLWEKHYGHSDNDVLWDIVESPYGCGGYVLAGWTNSGNGNDITENTIGSRDYWIIKVNQRGEKMWDQRIGGTLGDTLVSITATSDGGYLLGGWSISDNGSDKSDTSMWNTVDYWAVKIDGDGTILWNKTYGAAKNDRLTSVTEVTGGYYLLGGFSNSDAPGSPGAYHKTQNAFNSSNDYWVVKVKAGTGTKVWDKRFGGDDDDRLFQVRETPDRKYLLGGFSDSRDHHVTDTANGNYDYWVLKIDTSGTTVIWDRTYGGSSDDRMHAMESLELPGDTGFVLAGASKSARNSGNKSDTLYAADQPDYWVIRIDKNGNKIWDRTFGGTSDEGPLKALERYVDIKETRDRGWIIGGSSNSARNTGNKTDSLYNSSYDYWAVRIDSSGNKLWDRSFGGSYDDYMTAVDVDATGDYWIAGFSNSDSAAVGTGGNKQTVNYGSTSTSDFWVIRARDYCTHDSICFKWVQPTTVPDSLVQQVEPISCDSMTAEAIKNAIRLQVAQYIDAELEAFKDKYFLTCATPDSILDTLSFSYQVGYHHYTLYYHDRAGNLVRTVPPNGVDFESNRQSHNTHTFVTKYKYNSIKQLIEQQTPDGGKTNFWYDYKGQLRFSQNAKQLALSKYSYTKYDNLGRIIEVGESGKDPSTFRDSVNRVSYPGSSTSQRTYTVYTTAASVNYLDGRAQKYLQNRVSYVYNDDAIYTYYSYDPHGNVEWLIQEQPGLGRNYMRYEYDLISNKVLYVHYNESGADEFHHRYTYDEDQRIKKAETSRNGGIWDKDAQYTYYKHGPLRRVEIGEDKIQGIDYVYTIQGWLKGINYPTLQWGHDPGKDGGTGSAFGKDAFGMVLGYHADDFNRTGSKYNPSTAQLVSSQAGISNLYNGNISNWTLYTDSIAGNDPGQMGFMYRYDQLNRIKTEDYRSYSGSWSNPANTYDNTFTYDANGNILTLERKGNSSNMDNMTYNYTGGTNKLAYVDDAISSAAYATDIDDQAANTYLYDAIGQLVKDTAESIDTILWTVYNKIKTVKKSNGDSINFVYDAMQNRVQKIIKPNGGAATITFYTRDAQGNPLSIYERATSGSNYVYTQEEVPLYASSRVGEYKPNLTIKTVPVSGCAPCGSPCGCSTCTVYQWTTNTAVMNGYYARDINKKEYELTDHLGNVRAVVSDRKTNDDKTRKLAYMNYYAFGSELVGKTYSSSSYRYGFNGKEKDDEVKGSGNSLDFGARIYDSRLGRWMSVDPEFKRVPGQTPYSYSLNSPVFFIDHEGKQVKPTNKEADLAVQNFISSFDTEKKGVKMTGADLFGLIGQGTGITGYSSKHDLTLKQFTRLAKKYNLQGEQLRKAVSFYKALRLERISEVGIISHFSNATGGGGKTNLADKNYSQVSASSDLSGFLMTSRNIDSKNINEFFGKFVEGDVGKKDINKWVFYKGDGYAFFPADAVDKSKSDEVKVKAGVSTYSVDPDQYIGILAIDGKNQNSINEAFGKLGDPLTTDELFDHFIKDEKAKHKKEAKKSE